MIGQKKVSLTSKLMRDQATLISEVREAVGVSKATIYRYLNPDGTPRTNGAKAAR